MLCTTPILLFSETFLITFRLHGFKIMSHFDAVLYTARRFEMCEIVESTLFYLRDRPQVHSEVSGLPFMVRISLFNDNVCPPLMWWLLLVCLYHLFDGRIKIRFYNSKIAYTFLIARFVLVSFFIKTYPFLQRALQHDMPHRDFFSCLRETDSDFVNRSGWVYRKGASVYLPDNILVLPPHD